MTKEDNVSLRHRVVRTLRRHFLTGILVIVPLAATIGILTWVFINVDNILQPVIKAIFGRAIPGVGFGITIVLIYITGVIASNVLGRKILQYGESLLTRVPVFRPLYIGVKQVLEGLSGTTEKRAAFREVILVEFPRKGMRTLAFITNELTDESGDKLYCIYVPTAPVPTSGYFEIVSEDMVTHTNISVDQAIKMVMSSGIASPTKINTKGIVREPTSKS